MFLDSLVVKTFIREVVPLRVLCNKFRIVSSTLMVFIKCVIYSVHVMFRIRRHSKSLDVDSKVCGYCRAPFQLLYSSSKSQSTVPRTPNQFALFVKDNYASVKRSQPGMKHADVMSVIKTQYQQSKFENKPIAFHLDDDV